jgi:ribonuclease D
LSRQIVRDYDFLEETDDLPSVVAAIRSEESVAIDTEFLREKTYRARLCLVQLATSKKVWILDATRTGVSGIGELLEDPSLEIVVHSGRQDLELLVDLTGKLPRNIFDVQIAAGFVGLGASLPYGRLVEEVLGVVLTKGEAYTDWCRRPLSASQLKYAADDVRYLPEVARDLKKRLADLGRAEWLDEEMAPLENPRTYQNEPSEAWRRVSGRGSLSGRGLAVLRELAAWRERAANERDIPKGWVVKDHVLVEIARRSPQSIQELQRIRGLVDKQVSRWGSAILAAVASGRDGDPVVMPPAPPRAVLARARMLGGLADAVVRARCENARVAPELAMTRTELESLLIDAFTATPDPAVHRTLRGWRKDIVGDAVVALAAGKLAVRVVPDPPFIEEVEQPGDK